MKIVDQTHTDQLQEVIDKMTPEIIENLKHYKSEGFLKKAMCMLSGIDLETYFKYQSLYPDFLSSPTDAEFIEHRIGYLEEINKQTTGIDSYYNLTGRNRDDEDGT